MVGASRMKQPDPDTASMNAPADGTSLESGVREIAVGDVFAETYRVVKKLGEGGMGTVFLARDQKLDREVAVKVLSRHLCEDRVAVARFVYEARMTAKFDHPHIVSVYAVGDFHGRPFIVMKLLDGVSLAHQMNQRKGPWAWADVRATLAPLCSGLTYIHGQNLVHRDVKPSNVNLSPTGHVTLLDFGVIKELSKDRTGTGQLLGTLRYMAPEQITDPDKVDARADVYALGVMLYRLLVGKAPYEGDDLSVARMKVTEDARDARQLNPALPAGVAAVLSRAMHRDHEKRFPSANALLAAFDAAYAGPPPRPMRWVAAGTAGLIAVAAAAFALQPKEVEAPALPPAPAPIVVAAPAPPPLEPEPVAPVPEPAPVKPKSARPPPPRPVATGPAKLSVVTMVEGKPSYAELKVDGVSRGETPTQLELPAGSHRISVTRAGFKPIDRTVKVTAGKADRLVLELVPAR